MRKDVREFIRRLESVVSSGFRSGRNLLMRKPDGRGLCTAEHQVIRITAAARGVRRRDPIGPAKAPEWVENSHAWQQTPNRPGTCSDMAGAS